MALQIGRAISNGVRRSLSPIGVVLMGSTALYVGTFTSSVNTVVVNFLPPDVQSQSQIGVALPVSSPLAGVLALTALLFGMVIYIAAARAFTRDGADSGAVTGALFTRRIGRALLTAVVANLVISIATVVGFVLLVIPGVFLTVSFVFVVFAIAVEDARFLDSLRRSWDLARGHRVRLGALLLIVGVVTGLLSSVGSLLSIVSPALGQLATVVVTAPLAVVGYASIADAYLQIRAEEAAGFEA